VLSPVLLEEAVMW